MGDVAEQGTCKMQSRYAVLVNGMTTTFHKYISTTGIRHLPHQFVYTNGIRCGMCSRNNFLTNLILHRADQAAGIPHCAKQFPQQRCNGCFTIGARNTH